MAPPRLQRLEILERQLKDLAPELEKLTKLVGFDQPAALNKTRYITETVLLRLCRAHGVSWGNSDPTVENMIGPLVAKHVLPKEIAILVRTIQANASPGSHAQERPLTEGHLEIAQVALIEFLEWYAREQESSTPAGSPIQRRNLRALVLLITPLVLMTTVAALVIGTRRRSLPRPATVLVLPMRFEASNRASDRTLWPLADRLLVDALDVEERFYDRIRRIDPARVEMQNALVQEGGINKAALLAAFPADVIVDCSIGRDDSGLWLRCNVETHGAMHAPVIEARATSFPGLMSSATDALRAELWPNETNVLSEERAAELLISSRKESEALISLDQETGVGRRREILRSATATAAETGVATAWLRLLESIRDPSARQLLAAAGTKHNDELVREWTAELLKEKPNCALPSVEGVSAKYPWVFGPLARAGCSYFAGNVQDAVKAAEEAHATLALRTASASFLTQIVHYDEDEPEREVRIRSKMSRLGPESAANWARFASALANANRDDEALLALQAARSLLGADAVTKSIVGYHGASVHLMSLDVEGAAAWIELYEANRDNKGPVTEDDWLLKVLYAQLRGQMKKALEITRNSLEALEPAGGDPFTVAATQYFYLLLEAKDDAEAARSLDRYRARLGSDPPPGDAYGLAMLQLALDGFRGRLGPEAIEAEMSRLGKQVSDAMGGAGKYERAIQECFLASHLDFAGKAEALILDGKGSRYLGGCRVRYARQLLTAGAAPEAEAQLGKAIREIVRARIGGLGFIPRAILSRAEAQLQSGNKKEACTSLRRLRLNYQNRDRDIPEVIEGARKEASLSCQRE